MTLQVLAVRPSIWWEGKLQALSRTFGYACKNTGVTGVHVSWLLNQVSVRPQHHSMGARQILPVDVDALTKPARGCRFRHTACTLPVASPHARRPTHD